MFEQSKSSPNTKSLMVFCLVKTLVLGNVLNAVFRVWMILFFPPFVYYFYLAPVPTVGCTRYSLSCNTLRLKDVFAFNIRWMPESARWLIANGKLEQAQMYLKKCAAMNQTEKLTATVNTEVSILHNHTDSFLNCPSHD